MFTTYIWFDGGRIHETGTSYGSYEIRIIADKLCLFERVNRINHPNAQTSNAAEYATLLEALKKLRENFVSGRWSSIACTAPAALRLNIRSDSILVVEQIRMRWKSRTPHLTALRDQCRECLKSFGHWNIEWHSRKNNVKRFGH